MQDLSAVLVVIASSCPHDHFICSSGKCVPVSQICDLNNDCEDGSDELFCGVLTLIYNLNKTFVVVLTLPISCSKEDKTDPVTLKTTKELLNCRS